MENLELVLRLVAGLVGFPACLAAVINVLKYFGAVKDDQAGKVNVVAHLVAYVAVAVAVFTGKVDILPGIDVQLGNVANLLIAVLAFLSSTGIAKGFHVGVLRGLPLLGHSHTVING